MKTNVGKIIEFTDANGEQRILHGTRQGFRVKQAKTVVLALNRAIGKLLGENIKRARLARGMSRPELCEASGLTYAKPKAALYAIETFSRAEGIRLGTLYALARGLKVRPQDLLPDLDEAMKQAGVKAVEKVQLITSEPVTQE